VELGTHVWRPVVQHDAIGACFGLGTTEPAIGNETRPGPPLAVFMSCGKHQELVAESSSKMPSRSWFTTRLVAEGLLVE